MDISNINLLSLQTSQMQQDPTTISLCAALNPQFQELGEETKLCLIYSRIDDLDSDTLDELAWQMHMDWYDSTSDIDIKRSLVKSALKVHRYRGTPYAVEQVIQNYFGDGDVQEWFEYGGQPYYFRVITTNPTVTDEQASRFQMAVNAAKRLSAKLEEIIVSMSGELDIYCAGVVHTGDNITIEQVV